MIPPPQLSQSNLPIVDRALEAYKLWQTSLGHFPRLQRYSLGVKIDRLFTDVLERLLLAGYQPREQKIGTVIEASASLDLLKFFLRVAWEFKCLDNQKYAALSAPVNEIGKMLGGWLKQLRALS